MSVRDRGGAESAQCRRRGVTIPRDAREDRILGVAVTKYDSVYMTAGRCDRDDSCRWVYRFLGCVGGKYYDPLNDPGGECSKRHMVGRQGMKVGRQRMKVGGRSWLADMTI